jgi:prokaryotic ubiquitin-like protein Pup
VEQKEKAMTINTRNSRIRSGEVLEAIASEEHRPLAMVVGMAAGDQKQARRSDTPQDTAETRPASNIKERGETLKEDLDRIIDEIDEVLEENAEEFVKNYVQRGGE